MRSEKKVYFSYYVLVFKRIKQVIIRNRTSRIQLSTCKFNKEKPGNIQDEILM